MISTEIHKFEQQLARELTPELAGVYVQGLLKTVENVEKGVDWHFNLGEKLYGPLIVGYVEWLEKKVNEVGHQGNVYFALRDAAPLMTAAEIMWQGKTLKSVGVYVNRPLLGVDDEIAPEKAKVNGDMKAYLQGLEITGAEKVIWSDTGAWGTVVKMMKQTGLVPGNLYPLFWYSHNPHIPGYLNELLVKEGLPEKFGEVINDSLECVFPQQWLRPLELASVQGDWQPKLLPADGLSRLWGQAALTGVAEAAKHSREVVSEDKAINHLYKLHQEAKMGFCTGVLAENTPTWSNGEQFLAEWSEDLLP